MSVGGPAEEIFPSERCHRRPDGMNLFTPAVLMRGMRGSLADHFSLKQDQTGTVKLRI
jgi:hypothetical protein